MLDKLHLRRLHLATPLLRSSFSLKAGSRIRPSSLRYSTGPQSVTQPSFWTMLIPKPFRRSSVPPANVRNARTEGWNPATFYIVIFLVIGSMSIQMITLRNEFNTYSRRADAKVELLHEIIERVKKGEEVDVEGLLGTGDQEKEKEWDEVLREIENEDELWAEERRKKPRRSIFKETLKSEDDESLSSSASRKPEDMDNKPEKKSNAPSGFY